MIQNQISLLIVDDNPADVLFIERALKQSKEDVFQTECVATLQEAIETQQKNRYDLIILDLSLPDSCGLETFASLHCNANGTPIVVMSAIDDESLALKAVHLGAQDYLVKGQVESALLLRAIHYAIERASADSRIKELNDSLSKRVLDLARANEELDALTHSLALARDQALQASSFKSEFVARISHEVRTPLTAIMGTLELLSDTELSAEQKEFCEILTDSATSLLNIVNETLEFTKAEAGMIKLTMQDFSPITLLEGTADILAPSARKKRLRLMTYIDPAIPPFMYGDPVRLRQILLNFANNAIKFTDKGQIVIRATLEAINEPNYTIRWSVTDSGIGLSEEAQSKLFQPYVQINNTSTRPAEGTGLGLSICKRLVELMDGQIGAQSQLGKSSTFWFSVSMLCSSQPGIQTVRTQEIIQIGNLDRTRVLIVSDDTASREIFHKYVRANGIEDGCAAHADEAMFLLNKSHETESPYSVVILDLNSSPSERARFLNEIKDNPQLSSTKIVEITAFERNPTEGALDPTDVHLCPPVKRASLSRAIIQATTGQHQTRHEPHVPTHSAVYAGNHILIAEDSPTLQRVAKSMLEKLGFSVSVVSNGREAIEAFKNSAFSAILMDCQLPELDGWDATRRIRAIEQATGGHIPIIAMTGAAEESDKQRCLNAGMDMYLRKPVTMQSLEETLSKFSSATAKSS